jgi:hypothetical protein
MAPHQQLQKHHQEWQHLQHPLLLLLLLRRLMLYSAGCLAEAPSAVQVLEQCQLHGSHRDLH